MGALKVSMAELKVTKSPRSLITLGLGSCVGVALYDNKNKIAGLLHAMLPSASEIANNQNKAKFVDTGIDLLVEMMKNEGAINRNIVAKIAGGSQMFSFNKNSNVLKIGERNVMAAKEKLNSINIRIIAEDTGGNYGRTIQLNAEDGSFLVKTIGHGTKTI